MSGKVFFSGFDEFVKDYENVVLPEYLPDYDSVRERFVERIREDSVDDDLTEYLEPGKAKTHIGCFFHFAVIRGNIEYPDTIILYEFVSIES